MGITISLTKIPSTDTIVIKQSGGHYFITSQDSIIIDKAGLLRLVLELGKVGFLDTKDLRLVREELADYYLEEVRKEVQDATS